MANAKNEPEKNSFQLFIEKLRDIYNSSYENSCKNTTEKINKALILECLFERSPNTDNEKRFFKPEGLDYFLGTVFCDKKPSIENIIVPYDNQSNIILNKFFTKLC